jgi:hypothetical protein
MGFYELGNGCDSCDTISSVIPNNVNMQMDSNSGFVANMAMPYGAQQNTLPQFNNSISSSGYAQQGSNFGMMGGGSNGSTMGGNVNITKPSQTVAMQPTMQPNQVVKQVVTTTTTTPNVPGTTKVPLVANKVSNFEGFTDGASDMGMNSMHNDKKWIVLGLVIFSALSLNECCKYFLNKSLQLNDGSPLYYVAYSVVAILLTMAANKYATSN